MSLAWLRDNIDAAKVLWTTNDLGARAALPLDSKRYTAEGMKGLDAWSDRHLRDPAINTICTLSTAFLVLSLPVVRTLPFLPAVTLRHRVP